MPQNTTAAHDLLSEASDLLKASAPAVRSRLKDLLVEREIASRVEVLDKALTKLQELRREQKKLKPDQVSYDTTGGKIETWSKDAHEKKTKLESEIEKLNLSIAIALDGESFDKLREQVK